MDWGNSVMAMELYKFIIDETKHITNKVYPEQAPKNAQFPYVVFNFPTENMFEHYQDHIYLEIDIWSKSRQGVDAFYEATELTDEIDKVFKYKRHLDENYLLIFQRINKLAIPDEDSDIRHRQLRYLIKKHYQ